MLQNKIVFKSLFKGFIAAPQPSVLHLPEHYKKLKSFLNDSVTSITVKKCIPFLDASTVGYIIPFPVDIRFRYDKEQEQVVWELSDVISSTAMSHNIKPSSHPNFQIPNELRQPHRTVEAVFKWMNLWKIITPPGYSCIFTQPFNRNLPFQIIDGIVDTDSYNFQTHFPFYWTQDSSKTHVLKKGDPMILLIPFKRDDWKMKVALNKESYIDESKRKLKFFNVLLDNYKKFFWKKKSYK